ncbi:hypothetical protein [Streptomyces sp. KL118A]|uniref:hypothetical protein n=1 Tax=Streptomyces sp. KL118A TaxID=3045153 RepID=UPI00278C2F91|nr:hypothetical protein [Streptomyces sp. KL118A]
MPMPQYGAPQPLQDLHGTDTAPSRAYPHLGVAVGLYAVAAAGWIGYEAENRGADGGDFFTALYDPRIPFTPYAQTPHDWALITAALVFGGIAVARRRVARGALTFLAVMLIALSLRELVGLAISSDYRAVLERSEYGQFLIGFRVLGLLVGAATLIGMTRAGRRQVIPRSYAPHTARHTAAGVCLALSGAVAVAWLVYRLTRAQVFLVGGSPDAGVGGFFRDVVDASYSTSIPYSFHTVAFALAPLLVGAALLAGRPAGRGAGLALAFVLLYLDGRGLYAYVADGAVEQYFDSTLGTLAVLSTVCTAVLSLVTIAVLLSAEETWASSDSL